MSGLISKASNMTERKNGFITFTNKIDWFGAGFTSHGWGNGYCAIPEGHKLYGHDYDNIGIDIHGGLTYANSHTINGKKYWVYGFDTCHYNDTQDNWSETAVLLEVELLFDSLRSYRKRIK